MAIEDLFVLSKVGRSANSGPAPLLSNVPLITTARIAPSAHADAQNANRIEAVADLDASINSASEPAHAEESNCVCAAWETAKWNPITTARRRFASSFLLKRVRNSVEMAMKTIVKIVIFSIVEEIDGINTGIANIAMNETMNVPNL